MGVKKYFEGFLMALTMYTVIPIKFHKWEEENRPHMITCLPFVGLVIGAIWAALLYGLQFAVEGDYLSKSIAAVLLALYPFVISGGLHLDGFMDVTDATKSCRDLEERRRILKDSHVGSFATIGAIMLFFLWFASTLSLSFCDEDFHILVFVPIISRSIAGLAVSLLPTMSTSEYGEKFRSGISKGKIAFITICIILSIALSVFLCGIDSVAIVVLVIIAWLSIFKAYKSLQGMNGDIAGYSIVVSETAAILAFAIIEFVK